MVGAYHDLTSARESLACDFAEPLRPAVDRFILATFADGLLRPENFSTSEAQGCRLKKDARRDFYRAYEQEAVRHRPVLARIAEDFAGALRSRAEGTVIPAIAARPPEPGHGE